MLSKFLSVAIVAIFAAGCGVKANTYVMTKERVDIKETGNAGSMMGQNAYQEPDKKTRKVYVLEVTKAIPETEVVKIKQETTTDLLEVNTEEAPESDVAPKVETNRKIVIPFSAEKNTIVTEAEGPKEDVSYTVVKDDTLQKIAKKFYNSYGKWTKIYEANKDKLKNPNFVRPGTVITIPAVE